MAGRRPPLEDLPETFPVFPLTGALLLPGGKLPLNIFEPRYLALVEDALGAGRMFGMIQPDPRAPDTDAEPGLYQVGCLGRMSSFSETEDGRYLITLTGVIRYRVLAEIEGRRGYRRVRAALGEFAADLGTHPAELPGFDRTTLLAVLRRYFARRGFDANWEAIGAMGDEALTVTLAIGCPFESAATQALLEAPTPAEQARTLLSVLQIAVHEADADQPETAYKT